MKGAAAFLTLLLAAPAVAQSRAGDPYSRTEWHVMQANRCIRTSTMAPSFATPWALEEGLGKEGIKLEVRVIMMPGQEGSKEVRHVQQVILEDPKGEIVYYFPSFHKCRVIGNVIRLYEWVPEMPPQAVTDTAYRPGK